MRTQDEIVAKIKAEENDFFGHKRADWLAHLPFSAAKEFLKPEATEEGWKFDAPTEEKIRASILGYLPFAWDKANGCRGLSASRSIEHFCAWFWLLGDDEFSDYLDAGDDYQFYGKPQLVKISEKVGFDWRQHDDGRWANNESEQGITAEQALAA